MTSAAGRRRSRRPFRRILLAVAFVFVVGILGATFAVTTDTLGAGRLFDRAVAKVERFLAGPVPDRPTIATVRVSPRPATPSPTLPAPEPTSDPAASGPPHTPTPTPTPKPTPKRVPVDVEIAANPEAIFAHQLTKTWCAPASVQMTLAYLGLADISDEFQRKVHGRIREWESKSDSLNGNWGPAAMALALEAYGAPGYEVRAYEGRQEALRDSAVALEATGSPVILLTWRGAHTWVMTGFRANADPAIFPDARISGAYILDPWYPSVSSLWGPSDPPGTFQDNAEMVRNYLRWNRPEGTYPDRDGLFIALVPTVVVKPAD